MPSPDRRSYRSFARSDGHPVASIHAVKEKKDPGSRGAGRTVESQGPGDEGQGTSPLNLRETVEIVPAWL